MKTWLQAKSLVLAIAVGTSTAIAIIGGLGVFPTNVASVNNSNEEEPTGSPPPGSGIQRDFQQPS